MSYIVYNHYNALHCVVFDCVGSHHNISKIGNNNEEQDDSRDTYAASQEGNQHNKTQHNVRHCSGYTQCKTL